MDIDAHVRAFNVGNAGGIDAFKEAAALKRADYERKRWATWVANGYPPHKIQRKRD